MVIVHRVPWELRDRSKLLPISPTLSFTGLNCSIDEKASLGDYFTACFRCNHCFRSACNGLYCPLTIFNIFMIFDEVINKLNHQLNLVKYFLWRNYTVYTYFCPPLYICMSNMYVCAYIRICKTLYSYVCKL